MKYLCESPQRYSTKYGNGRERRRLKFRNFPRKGTVGFQFNMVENGEVKLSYHNRIPNDATQTVEFVAESLSIIPHGLDVDVNARHFIIGVLGVEVNYDMINLRNIHDEVQKRYECRLYFYWLMAIRVHATSTSPPSSPRLLSVMYRNSQILLRRINKTICVVRLIRYFEY